MHPAVVLLVLCCITAATAKPPPNRCLDRFYTHPREFDQCRDVPCFIFLSEPPYIILDKSMRSHSDSKLFPCGRPKKQFPHLGGTVFEVMKQSDAIADTKALCVWAGPDCFFNQMVDFLEHNARVNPNHGFGMTGLLLENEERLRPNVSQSISLVQAQLSIFGTLAERREKLPLFRLMRPFSTMTWLAFAAFSATLTVFGILTAHVFGPHSNKRWHFIQQTFHFYMDRHEAVVASKPRLDFAVTYDFSASENGNGKRTSDRFNAYKAVRLLMRAAISAMIAIFLLFYEVAVVNYLFFEQSQPNDISSLTSKDLESYAVEQLAATEKLWNQTAYPTAKYNYNKYPWERCKDLNQCFDWALDEKHPTKFVVGFKSAGIYQMRTRDACTKMIMYQTPERLNSFGAGWLYGSGIKEKVRRQIDLDILEMHMNERLPSIINGGASSNPCRHIIYDIDVGIIGASILVLVLPQLVIILSMMFCFSASVLRFSIADNLFRSGRELSRRRKARKLLAAMELEAYEEVTRPKRAATYGDTESESTLRLDGFLRLQTI